MATLSPAGGVGHWVRRLQVQSQVQPWVRRLRVQVQVQPRLTAHVAAWLDESPRPTGVGLALVGRP
jgi:hypothetical protein